MQRQSWYFFNAILIMSQYLSKMIYFINLELCSTLKDFKNAKIEIHKIYIFLYQFHIDLVKMNIDMSAKHPLNLVSK